MQQAWGDTSQSVKYTNLVLNTLKNYKIIIDSSNDNSNISTIESGVES